MRSGSLLSFGLLWSLLLLPGCGSESRATVVLTDSRGRAVVEHSLWSAEAPVALFIRDEPLTIMGALEGDERYQFFGVLDAYRGHDGSIFVSDRSRSIRAFDRDGQHLWSSGRRGDGPGEYQWPSGIAPYSPDSLLVWDALSRRITILARSDGTVGRTLAVPSLSTDSKLLGVGDSRVVILEHGRSERSSQDGIAIVDRHAEYLFLMPLDGSYTEAAVSNSSRSFRDPMGAYGPPIFYAMPTSDAGKEGLWLGDPTRSELRFADDTGLRRIVRWIDEPRLVTSVDLQAVQQLWGDSSGADPEDANYARRYVSEHPVMDEFPLFDALVVGADGRVWLREYSLPHVSTDIRAWMSYSEDAEVLTGRLHHVDEFTPLRFGSDWVLGVLRDSLDVESVVVHELVPAESDSS